MEIRLPPLTLSASSLPKGVADWLARLTPGQTLTAEVETKLGETTYLLRLTENGQAVRAQGPRELVPGQVLRLEVTSLGATPKRRLLPQAQPEAPETRAIQQALRNALPRQLGLAEWAAGLRQAVSDPAAKSSRQALPEPLRAAVRALLENLPTQSDLSTPAGVKKALEGSGLFYESRLASALDHDRPVPPAGDFKLRLLHLLKQLEPLAHAGKAMTGEAAPDSSSSVPTPAPPKASLPSSPAHPATAGEAAPKTSDSAPAPTQPAAPAARTAAALLDGSLPSDASGDAMAPEGADGGVSAPQPDTAPPEDGAGPPVTEQPSTRAADSRDKSPASAAAFTEGAAGKTAGRDASPAQTEPSPSRESPVQSAQGLQGEASRTERAPERPDVRDAQAGGDFDTVLSAPNDPKTLLHKAEGALARVVLDQLASQPQAEGRQTVWQVQIPFTDDAHTDAARLKIVRERRTLNDAEQAYWSVELELHPPGLGGIHSRITLAGGRIDSHFWSDRQATADLIQSHLELLEARLRQAGLDVGRLDTLPARPEAPSPGARLPRVSSLFSERA
jgi:flagellar hook-length control protein FliK